MNVSYIFFFLRIGFGEYHQLLLKGMLWIYYDQHFLLSNLAEKLPQRKQSIGSK